MCDLIKCQGCIHFSVCGEKIRWKQYVEDHLRLRARSTLFDKDPICPYYIDSEDKKTEKVNVRVCEECGNEINYVIGFHNREYNLCKKCFWLRYYQI